MIPQIVFLDGHFYKSLCGSISWQPNTFWFTKWTVSTKTSFRKQSKFVVMIPNINKEKSNALVKLTEPSLFLCAYRLFKHITTMLKTKLLKIKQNKLSRKKWKFINKICKKFNNSFFISHENLRFKNLILERPVLTRYYSLGTFWVRSPQWSINFDVCFTNTIFLPQSNFHYSWTTWVE